MKDSSCNNSALQDWPAREAISFSIDSSGSFNAAIDRMMAAIGGSVQLLGIGEPMHGAPEFLVLRNRLFQRLVEAHGFSAIAMESSFPRGRVANEFVAGRGPDSYAGIERSGFSHGFGRQQENRELIEWMREYNRSDDVRASRRVALQFYGFDAPTEMTVADSPRTLLQFVLAYLDSIDGDSGNEQRRRIEALLGEDSAWESSAAMFDPGKSIGLSPAASALRIETEDLITRLQLRRPELIAKSDALRYLEAAHYASQARQLLNYHATMARASSTRLMELLGTRDHMMAENLAYITLRENARGGKVLAFAHNSHLKRGQAHWRLGDQSLKWWPAGSHLHHLLGERYAVIGTGVGVSDSHGISPPEPGTLEAMLTAAPGPARLIATSTTASIPAAQLASLPTRSSSAKNASYFPLTPQSLTDFDWLAVLDSIA